MDFLYTAISWVLLRWHDFFDLIGLDPAGSPSWVLSIVFLVITARLALVRLFIKQVHYQRHMMKVQPKMQKIREKYKNDRQEMQRQMMALQQEEGFNPLAGCLPMVLQVPVFLGLYHTLRHLSNSAAPLRDKAGDLIRLADGHTLATLCNYRPKNDLLTLYSFDANQTCDAAKADLFGAPLASSFNQDDATIRALGGDPSTAKWVLIVLVLVSAAATLATQLLVRWNAPVQPEGTAATVQKVMLYLIPGGVLASGLLFNFPIGVLLYWFVSNLWTLGQQAYIIRFHPHDDPKETQPVKGEAGKALAPKPGQRPMRGPKAEPDATDEPASSPTSPTPAARSAPRPGQRPNRPGGGGKRPAGKRPTQAKKRR